MARQVIDITRRQLLLGAGGAMLALPVLPSLLERRAYGADPVYTRKPRLYWLCTDHGAAFESSMFPAASLASNRQMLFADHEIGSGALTSSMNGDARVVSPILSASSSRFSEALLGKMNVLYGLDVPFYIAHNTGLHLGNYARNDGNGGDGKAVQDKPRPTIDQLLAWSPHFYADLSTIRERAMIMSSRPVSWNYSDPDNRAGTIDNVRGYDSSKALFDKIFVAPDAGMPARPPIVDRVLESYKNLRNGNKRLSAADKQRLDDHMARIAELERKLTAKASCGDVMKPTDDAQSHLGNSEKDAIAYGQLWNEVVAAAFVCGTSRIGVLGYGSTDKFVAYGGDWHQEVAHQWQLPDKQELIKQSYQKVFEGIFLDLAAKLDVEEAPGMTYLDNSLLVWSQECGMSTHDSVTIPVITFGSAAGYFKTGQLADFRRIGNASSTFDPMAGGKQYLGLLYNQWLATVLQAMGVPPSDFERWGHKGYGVPYVSTESWTPPYAKHYGDTSSKYFTMASDPLPLIKA
ncbi:MAG TPA: DUF1552 domain-containing protein [Polyangiaceae bacterium]|nr:DUF1552 domain-containing protein [Polyangiaceae bacterium]